MPFLRVLPYRQIAEEVAAQMVAERAGCDALEPWRREVIVPSRGVAEGITAALLARVGTGVAGVEIHSLENLARRIVNRAGEFPRVASPEERRLAMRMATRQLDDPLRESRGIASMLERSYRDLRDSGGTVAGLARRAASQRRLRNPQRTASIVRAWQEYEQLVAGLGAIDPADLLARAAQLVSSALPLQFAAGFYDMTGVQRTLLRALEDAGRLEGVWVPSSAPFAQPFIASISAAAQEGTPAEPPHLSATRYDTRLDEVRGVCASVARLLATGTDPRRIGIVARSFEPFDTRLLNRCAREAGFRTTLGEEIPLRSCRIGRGVATLLRLRDRGFPRGDVLELVRDGLRVKTRLRVDDVDAATRRARIAGGTSEELRRIRSRQRPVEDYLALVTELEELTAAPLDLLPRLGSLLRLETEADLAAAGALEEIAALFRRATVWNRGTDLPSVLDAIEQATLPLTPERGGGPLIWAGDVMRFRGRSFDETFVLRMEDDVFPQRRLEDPLVPDSDRRLLGLREIGDGAEEERLLFSLVSGSTSSAVRLSRAGGDGFGKVLRASRYLRGVEEVSNEARTGEGSSANGALPQPVNLPRQLQLLARRATNGVFDGFVGPLPEPLASRLESLSPTQLEDFGECPQKFLLKHVLGAEDIDQPERELQINHRDKGTLDHRILERFYRSTTAEEIDRATLHLPQLDPRLQSRLDGIIDEQFDALAGDVPPFNPAVRAIERRATRRLLREFLLRDLADLAATGLRPGYFEYRFGAKHREEADQPEPFVVRGADAVVRVEGTIDRVDAGGGRLRIVDYKSGKALRHVNLAEKIDRGVRLQLPLYAMAAAEFFGVEASCVSGTIRPLVAPDSARYDFELAEKHARLLETLDLFLGAIRRGAFPAFPEEKAIGSCKYCPVNHACRTRHDADEKNEVLRHGDARTLLGGDPA